jgi:transcriptional regulator with XRE-family HTH domain
VTKLKILRLERRLSLFDVGKNVDIRDNVLSTYERRRNTVYPKHRRALAAFYGVSENDLFEDGFAKEVNE